MTSYPIQSNYPGTEPISHCPILIMLSAWLESDRINFKVIGLCQPGFEPTVQIRTREVWILQSSSMGDGHSTHSVTLSVAE